MRQNFPARLALTHYQRVIDRDPENTDGWSQNGFALRKLGKLEQAAYFYYQVFEIVLFHLGAKSRLGALNLSVDQLHKAVEMAEILERACPDGYPELSALRQAIETCRSSGGAVKWDKQPGG